MTNVNIQSSIYLNKTTDGIWYPTLETLFLFFFRTCAVMSNFLQRCPKVINEPLLIKSLLRRQYSVGIYLFCYKYYKNIRCGNVSHKSVCHQNLQIEFRSLRKTNFFFYHFIFILAI